MIKDIWNESSFAGAAYDLFRPELVAEGLAEGMREIAQVGLEGRYGTLDADIIAALATADEATCRAIVAHLTTDTMEAVRQRLGLR